MQSIWCMDLEIIWKTLREKTNRRNLSEFALGYVIKWFYKRRFLFIKIMLCRYINKTFSKRYWEIFIRSNLSAFTAFTFYTHLIYQQTPLVNLFELILTNVVAFLLRGYWTTFYFIFGIILENTLSNQTCIYSNKFVCR